MITDPADPRIAAYGQIRERDLTGRGERFIIEGKVTLGILIERSRFEIESLFVTENRLAAIDELLQRVPARIPVYTASQALFDTIAGFPVHRGILACARKGRPVDPADLFGGRVLLGAIGISNHDNIGALFRNGAAFGADGVILDATSCDPLYRKSIRVSAGTTLWLPFSRMSDTQEMLRMLRTAGFDIWALTPQNDAAALWDMPVPEKLVLLVGAEGPGLPETILQTTRNVRIPMRGDVDSLNVATSAAIALARVYAG